MKKILFILIISLQFNLEAQSRLIGLTTFSYSNVGNEYSFYLLSHFGIGSWGSCPHVRLVTTIKSNDTVYINAFYDVSGAWTLVGCSSRDTVKYTNPFSDVHFINIASSEYYGPDKGDTTYNVFDTTFNLSPTHIDVNSINAKHFTIYPNPSRNLLYIKSITGIAWSELKIYNTLGQMLLAEKENKTTINISQLPIGMYCLQLFDYERNNIGIIQFLKE